MRVKLEYRRQWRCQEHLLEMAREWRRAEIYNNDEECLFTTLARKDMVFARDHCGGKIVIPRGGLRTLAPFWSVE